MQLDDLPSPLTVAARLLSTRGENAVYEAMQRSIDYRKLGEVQAEDFWARVAAEVFDALTSGAG